MWHINNFSGVLLVSQAMAQVPFCLTHNVRAFCKEEDLETVFIRLLDPGMSI